ncbi:hypothetical protein ABPG74_015641 [Tetrahymena malaccensis]
MTELNTPEKNYNLFSEIIFEGEDKIKALELLVNKRKIQIQNLDPCMPLSAYISEDQVLEYVSKIQQDYKQIITLFNKDEHWENPDQVMKQVNDHVIVFDYSNAKSKNKNVKNKDQSKERYNVIYKEAEREIKTQPQRAKSGLPKRKIVNAEQQNLAKRF